MPAEEVVVVEAVEDWDGSDSIALAEAERDEIREALYDLVASVREVHIEHAPHDGRHTCLRCRADRLAEEFSL